jgi:branched-chain amino acid transport system substrate-binding protein
MQDIPAKAREEGVMRRLGSFFLAALLASGPAAAEIAGGKVKIGVLTDMSGIFSVGLGTGMVTTTKMAVEDFGGKINGVPIEVLSADHQNKPDVATSIASRWYDVDGVNAITDVGITSVAFGVLELAKVRNRTVLLVSTGSDEFTGKACAPNNSVHWLYDSYQTSAAVGTAVPLLGKKWVMLSADYAYGRAMEVGITGALKKNGAEVVGSFRHPVATNDFSSYMLQIKSLAPDVVALNSGGDDTANAVKSAREFGVKAKLVGFGLDTPALIKAMTLQTAHDVYYMTSWMRRDDPETEAFVKRFMEVERKVPSAFQVGNYSAVRNYLLAVQAVNSTDSAQVIKQMRKTPVRDVLTDDGYLRPDGRMVHSTALMQIKTPAESKGEWDLARVVAPLKGDDVFRPLGEGGCNLAE